ncbi:MAG: cation:proton antiporter [Spirochaetae bacterium HGW-Spirochaetae-8]|nr:MAG: cation:proton antiporter [Spirochaetae bacterium HGW-Spirochaetae-8]
MTALGLLLVLIGLWGILTRRNIIRIIIAFTILDTGVHLIMVGLGYVTKGTAPILDSELATLGSLQVVDPVPSALVLTAIVIGLAVTALMLSYAIRLYQTYHTLSIDEIKEMKW